MKRISIISVLLVLALVFGFWKGLPAYRHWKEQRALTRAREFFVKGDFRNAAISARLALVINSKNAEACRIMGAITEALRAPAAIEWRQRLVEAEPDSFTNRVELVRTALLFGRYDGAARAMDAVPNAYRDTPTFHQLAAMVAIGLNNIGLAERHLSRVAELQPTNKIAQLNRAVIRLNAKDQNVVAEALKTLEELYHDPVCHNDALRNLALAASRNGDFAKAVALTAELQSETNAPLDDRLLHLGALRAAGDAMFTNYLGDVETRCETNAEFAGVLGAWLLSHEMADEANRWLAGLPELLQTNSAVRLARADAFIAKKDWAGLRAFGEDADWKEIDFLRHAMMARALRESREELAFQVEWREATRDAADNPKRAGVLARLSKMWDWPRENEDLLWTIVRRFPGERWAIEALNETYLANGDTPGLQRLYAMLLNFSPDDLGAKNNFATTSLLLNVQTNEAHQLAREVYLAGKTNAVFASTYAFSLHLQGRDAEALQVMSALSPEQLTNPSIALYYGALQVTNSPLDAKKYLDFAARGALLPEERDLLQSARRGL